MINFIKRYYRYIIIGIVFLLAFIISFIISDKQSIETKKDEKLTLVEKKEETNKTSDNEKTEDNKTVFVDIKGAVASPGVYELSSSKRIIDVINLAGGLSDNANTINLNLSKKVEDEMYIIVYTKNEIYNYKKQNDNKKIECASNECICPDSNNAACINNTKTSEVNSSTSNEKTGKISINSASKEELMTLTGVGEAKANAIISYRNENGAFKEIEDIKNVSGIGNSIYEKIKDNISI